MKTPALLLIAIVALATAVPGMARQKNVTDPGIPRSLPTEGGAVSVSWTDPAQFSEIKYSGSRWESERGTWVTDLAKYLRDKAGQQLARGQTLDIVITDIDRAGRYEPSARSAMNDIRIVKDIYPPRIALSFSVKGPDGQVIAEGERKLVDHGFLMGPNLNNNDTLRYEKRLIDDWLRKEFRSGQAVTATP
ncbi:DUF3016 domain-containing protein [Pseudoxanthomonas sp. LARHCG66]